MFCDRHKILPAAGKITRTTGIKLGKNWELLWQNSTYASDTAFAKYFLRRCLEISYDPYQQCFSMSRANCTQSLYLVLRGSIISAVRREILKSLN